MPPSLKFYIFEVCGLPSSAPRLGRVNMRNKIGNETLRICKVGNGANCAATKDMTPTLPMHSNNVLIDGDLLPSIAGSDRVASMFGLIRE